MGYGPHFGIFRNLSFLENRKMVFVAERGSFTYAMGRMFCINAEYVGCRSEIFLNMVDALAWLNGGGMNDESAAPIDAS